MSLISNTFYGFARPLILGLLLIIGLSMMSTDPANGSGSFGCQTLTNRPEINRALCKLNPARFWNTPVADLIPSFK